MTGASQRHAFPPKSVSDGLFVLVEGVDEALLTPL